MSEDSHMLNHSRNSTHHLPRMTSRLGLGVRGRHTLFLCVTPSPTALGLAIWVSTRLCHHSFIGFSSTRVQRCKSTHQSTPS
ncbi:hypothetical protein CABS01_07615 [Colletotrichum abscissum]|uniref:uncharacterized protein n=1 Tax=Colletotrichum abscissum TaxID=1671311 RepID=UPI0027D6E0AE|nr:uncharacterized protein CABS01_07615 [Colletotrichum abscissum]KAK1511657.1 hypothetical protein CABS01_07615 [Colletotrichum abscissum]